MQDKSANAMIYLQEELGDARMRCDQLVRYVTEALKLVEKSTHRDHFFEVAGHIIYAVPDTLFKLQKALEAVALASNRMDYEELKNTLRPEKVQELERVLQEVRIKQVQHRSQPSAAPGMKGSTMASDTRMSWDDDASKESRFEEGVPADPTQNMSEEDAEKWKENTEEYKDNFKAAAATDVASKKKLVIKLLGSDVEWLDGYSGRGMFGKESPLALTTGKSPSSPEGKKLKDSGFSVDSLGKEFVYYLRGSAESKSAAAEMKPKFEPDYEEQLALMVKNPPRVSTGDIISIEVYSPFVKKYIPMAQYRTEEFAKNDMGIWNRAHKETLAQLRATIKGKTASAADVIEKINARTWDWGLEARDDLDKIAKEAAAASKKVESLKDKVYLRAVEKKARDGAIQVVKIFGETKTAAASADISKLYHEMSAHLDTFDLLWSRYEKNPEKNAAKLVDAVRYVKALRDVADIVLHALQEKRFKVAGDDSKESRFEEGVPADPTENMSDEDAEKWKEENEKNKDNFKEAASSSKVFRFPEGTMTEREWVERFAVRVEEAKVRDWHTLIDRRKWNSLDGDEQKEYETKLKKQAEKPVYRAWKEGESSFQIVSKDTYLWAKQQGIKTAAKRTTHLEGKKGHTMCGERAYDDTIVDSVKDTTCYYCKQAWEKSHSKESGDLAWKVAAKSRVEWREKDGTWLARADYSGKKVDWEIVEEDGFWVYAYGVDAGKDLVSKKPLASLDKAKKLAAPFIEDADGRDRLKESDAFKAV